MIFCIYRRDRGCFGCTGGAVVSGRGRDKGERMARLAVAVLIDANESQSNQSPGLTQALAKEPSAWRRQNHHPNPLVCSRPAVYPYPGLHVIFGSDIPDVVSVPEPSSQPRLSREEQALHLGRRVHVERSPRHRQRRVRVAKTGRQRANNSRQFSAATSFYLTPHDETQSLTTTPSSIDEPPARHYIPSNYNDQTQHESMIFNGDSSSEIPCKRKSLSRLLWNWYMEPSMMENVRKPS